MLGDIDNIGLVNLGDVVNVLCQAGDAIPQLCRWLGGFMVVPQQLSSLSSHTHTYIHTQCTYKSTWRHVGSERSACHQTRMNCCQESLEMTYMPFGQQTAPQPYAAGVDVGVGTASPPPPHGMQTLSVVVTCMWCA